MRVESNGVSRTQSATVQNEKFKKNEGLKITPNFDSIQVSRYSFLDENGIPKNFLLGGDVKLPHGSETEMNKKIENAYLDYYTGKCDEESVRNTLSEVVESLRDNYVDLGYDEKEIMPHIIEDVYARARVEVVTQADTAGFRDSQKLIAQYNGHNGNTKDSIYYDSDYYYKSEAMKTALLEYSKELGEKYGAANLNLPKGYERSDPRHIYSSYNTMVNHYAGYQWNVGNMIDEDMAPPENFRFFYKSGDCGTNIYSGSLKEVAGDGADMFDGVLHVWQGDWSFTGRVPTRSNAIRNPAVNMYDVVRKGTSSGIPKESIDFLKNFDFFSPVQSDNYFRFQYLR